MQKIHVSIVEGKPAVCFDTGLDPRSFARTKMSQSLVEQGQIVYLDGSHEIWKSAGVKDLNGNMRVWGQPVGGKRLDIIIDKEKQDTALQAIAYWIRAKMLLGEPKSAQNPGAAFVCYEDDNGNHKKGTVFFAPPYLSNRCLHIEGTEDHFNCPDLTGMEAAAFCAGVMLYKILAKAHPYKHTADIFQDMREGVFLPLHLTAVGINQKLCELINAALLLPVERRRTGKSGIDILGGILNILMGKDSVIVSVPALFSQKTKEENTQIAKQRSRYLFKQNASVKTRRFATRNKYFLIGTLIGILFVAFLVLSTTRNYKQRPTTEGMPSDKVVMAYYDAFSRRDHIFMEAIIQGADKTDVNAAAGLYAITKTRELYEGSGSSLIAAGLWQELGGELPAPNVFGVTDLKIIHRDGSEDEDMIVYQADYLLWTPMDDFAFGRSDILILKLDRRKNWRIVEILRTEK